MAVSGHNGNNETLIGMSNAIDLSFYDENLIEIEIRESQLLIDLLISRDINLPDYAYQYVNASLLEFSHFLPNAFNITTINASLHIELKPLNANIGYVVIVKLGQIPIVTSSFVDYDFLKIFCPSKTKKDLMNDENLNVENFLRYCSLPILFTLLF